MHNVRTSELHGAALDWAVIVAEHGEHCADDPEHVAHFKRLRNAHALHQRARYSERWDQGGPIIEREGINVQVNLAQGGWHAMRARPLPGRLKGFSGQFGPTPLVAAMRCYVASKLGDTVDIPDGLEVSE